jgi:hypothetical protein
MDRTVTYCTDEVADYSPVIAAAAILVALLEFVSSPNTALLCERRLTLALQSFL